MKSHKLTIAIISCTLSITACNGGMETGDVTLDDVSGSTYQQALSPNGDVDCDRLHDALEEHGIDPALLEPEIVFEACFQAADVSEETCHAVAYSCFGDQCDDGHTPPPPTDDCDELWERLDQSNPDGSYEDLWQLCEDGNVDDETCALLWQCTGDNPDDPADPGDGVCQLIFETAEGQGINPNGVSADEALQACLDAGYDDQLCSQVQACFEDPTTQPPSDATCQALFDEADNAGIDIDGMSAEEVLQACIDAGYDAQLCQSVIDMCLDSSGQTDPNGGQPVDCAYVEEALADAGIDTPVDEATGMVLYEECIQQTGDEDLCAAAVECVSP